jgi:hypothetical protein
MAIRFAGRKCEGYRIISLLPDICITPDKKGIPVPYPTSIDLSGSQKVAQHSNFNGKPAFLHDKSHTVKVEGDEPGQGKGVKSGTVGEKAEALTYSDSVYIEGLHLVREGDLFYMNNRNNIGRLVTRDSGNAPCIREDGKLVSQCSVESKKQEPKPKFFWRRRPPIDNRTFGEKVRDYHLKNDTLWGKIDRNVVGVADFLGGLERAYRNMASGNIANAINDVRYTASDVLVGKKLKATKKTLGKVQDAVDMVTDLVNGELPLKGGKKSRKSRSGSGGNGGGGNNNNNGGKSKGKGPQCRSQTPKGECGEQLVKQLKGKGFKPLDTDSLKNQSGNGLDHVFSNKKHGKLLFVETKSTAAGGSMPLSKLQSQGGQVYSSWLIDKMKQGYYYGTGLWKATKDNEEFGKKIKELEDEVKAANNISYKVCRIQLEADPTGCYGQKVNKQGKLSTFGKETGTCKKKKGTQIECGDWKPKQKPAKSP